MRESLLLRVVALAAALLIGPVHAAAQDNLPTGSYPYEDHGAADTSFAAFRAQLLRAAHRRDVEAVIGFSTPDIFLSFGGDAGHADFRRMLGEFPELWDALIFALENGTWRTDEEYAAPYWFSMPVEGAFDPYTTAFVPARDVVVRAAPSVDAPAISAVSYGYVALTPPYLSPGEGDYQSVRTPGGVEGFMAVEFLHSLIGYRAGFTRDEAGRWRMRFFLAGD